MNKDIGLGIIGLSAGADMLAINADFSSRLRVVAICDSDAAAARATGDRHQIPFVTTDPVDLLSQPGVDAVAVFGEVGERYAHCMAALRAGKRVLCGTPMAATLEEARELARESERLGGLLMPVNPARWEPRVAAAQALAASCELGDIHFVRSHVLANGQGPSIDPAYLSVPLDLMRWVAGEVDQVHAFASAAAVSVNVRFASGAAGSATVIRGPVPASAPNIALALHGDAGSCVDGQVVLNRIPGAPSMAFAFDGLRGCDFGGCLREFESKMLDGAAPAFDAWDAVRTVAVCAAVCESLRTGVPAPVPPIDVAPVPRKRAHRKDPKVDASDA
jgi:predicted dehydrogenase